MEEITSVLKDMKNGRVPGDDELPIEIPMSGDPVVLEW